MAQNRTTTTFHVRPVCTWQPPVNVYEDADTFVICVELAGVDPDRVDVQVHGSVVRICGQRAAPNQSSRSCPARIHVMEIDQGQFSREITLPQLLEVDRVEASYKDGMLWINLPKKST